MGPIYLERHALDRCMARFYAIHIEPTLFGEWAVIYNWGRIDTSGQSMECWVDSWIEAVALRDRKIKAKTNRGYSPR
jgi:predicted DNA-binding WGR domain protein